MTDRTVWWVIGVAAVLRFVMAAIVPIVPDEAYYWEWSRHLAAGYFDHPPMIALLIRAGTLVAGDTTFGLRCVTVLIGTLATVAAVALAQRIGGVVAARRAAWAVLAMPLAGAGLVLATPDVPLLAALAIGLFAVDLALASSGIAAVSRWMLAGAALGVGLASKYTALLFGVGITLALLARKDLRAQWRYPGPYVAIIVAAIVFLPVVFWNANHHWVSFQFQLQHGLVPKGHSTVFSRELSLIGGQLGLVSPILFVLIVLAVANGLRREPRIFVVAAVATFLAAFFVYSATRRSVEPNWLAPAVLAGTIVWAAQRKITTRLEKIGLALGVALVAGIYVQVIVPFLPLPARRDPTAQGAGWASLAREIDGMRQGAWIATNRYQDAAELAFHLKGHPAVFSLNIGGRPNEYDLWPQLSDRARAGDTVLVVMPDDPRTPDAIVALLPHCTSMARGETVELRRGREVIGVRRIWTCAGWTAGGTPLRRTLYNSST